MDKFDRLLNHYGSQAELARELGVTRQAVSGWAKDNCIPPKQAIIIENMTNGRFSAIELSCGMHYGTV